LKINTVPVVGNFALILKFILKIRDAPDIRPFFISGRILDSTAGFPAEYQIRQDTGYPANV
jgi:hypothetical protein